MIARRRTKTNRQKNVYTSVREFARNDADLLNCTLQTARHSNRRVPIFSTEKNGFWSVPNGGREHTGCNFSSFTSAAWQHAWKSSSFRLCLKRSTKGARLLDRLSDYQLSKMHSFSRSCLNNIHHCKWSVGYQGKLYDVVEVVKISRGPKSIKSSRTDSSV
jgi:hypothetical protein